MPAASTAASCASPKTPPICCAALAASCSKSADTSAAPAKTIGISIPAADHGWTGGVVYWAGQAKKDIEAANPGVKVLVSSAKDSADQVSGIENLLVRGVDALVVLPNEPAPLTPVCKQAAGRGVKLVVVDRGLAEPVQTLEVVGDNPGFGRVGAERVAEALGGEGLVAVMQGIPCQVNTDRVEAFRAEMAKHPGIRIIADDRADWNTEKGYSLMEAFLQKHDRIDAVWAGDDDVLLGAIKACRDMGRDDVRVMIGGGGSRAVMQMILDGDPVVTQTVTYPTHMIHDAALMAMELLDGGNPAPRKVVPAEVIDASNAAENLESAY